MNVKMFNNDVDFFKFNTFDYQLAGNDQLMDKTIRLQAFSDVMTHERDNQELSNLQLLARINQFEDYLKNDESTVHRHLENIFSDIASNLEGDVKDIKVYSNEDRLNVYLSGANTYAIVCISYICK